MIQSEWDGAQQRYIYIIFAGRWNWAELAVALENAHQLVADIDRPVYYVVHMFDQIARSHVPPNVFSYASTYPIDQADKMAKIIIVNASSVAFGIMSIVFRLYPDLKQYYVFAATLEEAERMIMAEESFHEL